MTEAKDIAELLRSGEFPAAELLTPEDLAHFLPYAKQMEEWAKDIQAQALDLALKGAEIPGYKIVAGRSTRVITNAEGLIEKMKGLGYKESVIYKDPALNTITTLEQLIGKKQFLEIAGPFIGKTTPAPVLVENSDKREALSTQSATDEFNDGFID